MDWRTKMTKVIEIDAATNQVIERDPTEAELEQSKKDAKEKAKIDADKLAKATQKAALLDKLGITADEAALLLS